MLRQPGQRHYSFHSLTVESLKIQAILESIYCYEQQYIKYIKDGLVHIARGLTDILKHEDCVKKIEGYEKLSPLLRRECLHLADYFRHSGPVTCHLFDSPQYAESFPLHVDPDNVVLYVVSGTKHMEINGKIYEIKAGEYLYISANTPHRAVNYSSSLMLSFGLELFTEEKF